MSCSLSFEYSQGCASARAQSKGRGIHFALYVDFAVSRSQESKSFGNESASQRSRILQGRAVDLWLDRVSHEVEKLRKSEL